MLGGLLGAVDMHSKALLGDCSAQNGSVSGGMNVGGIFGGAGIYSSVLVTGCDNSSSVKGIVAGAGGIVGTADTLQVVGSRNYARIEGPDFFKQSEFRNGDRWYRRRFGIFLDYRM